VRARLFNLVALSVRGHKGLGVLVSTLTTVGNATNRMAHVMADMGTNDNEEHDKLCEKMLHSCKA
jgi:hypothetical protein